MVGRNGQTIFYEAQTTLPMDGKPGPCYDHPGALADQDCFIRRLVGSLGKYENIAVWNTWQEVAYWPQAAVGQAVCFLRKQPQRVSRLAEGKIRRSGWAEPRLECALPRLESGSTRQDMNTVRQQTDVRVILIHPGRT